VVDSTFGSFSFWTAGKWGNPLSCDLYRSRGTCNTEVCHGFGPASASARVTTSGVVILSF
jgi:hypothetical protein